MGLCSDFLSLLCLDGPISIRALDCIHRRSSYLGSNMKAWLLRGLLGITKPTLQLQYLNS